MRPYFEKMDGFGKELKPGRIKRAAESAAQLKQVEANIDEQKQKVEQAGFTTEKINERGWVTVWDAPGIKRYRRNSVRTSSQK